MSGALWELEDDIEKLHSPWRKRALHRMAGQEMSSAFRHGEGDDDSVTDNVCICPSSWSEYRVFGRAVTGGQWIPSASTCYTVKDDSDQLFLRGVTSPQARAKW